MDEVAAPADYLFALTVVSVHLCTKEHENNEMLELTAQTQSFRVNTQT